MIISNGSYTILNYEINESFLHDFLTGYSNEGIIDDFDSKIKPRINIADYFERDGNRGNFKVLYTVSFCDEKTKTTIISFKGVALFDFILENMEKDIVDIGRIYEENYGYMRRFILENSMIYASKIEFHPYKSNYGKDFFEFHGFYG